MPLRVSRRGRECALVDGGARPPSLEAVQAVSVGSGIRPWVSDPSEEGRSGDEIVVAIDGDVHSKVALRAPWLSAPQHGAWRWIVWKYVVPVYATSNENANQ